MADLSSSMAALGSALGKPAHERVYASEGVVARCICGAEISIHETTSKGVPMILHQMPPCQQYNDLDFLDYLALINKSKRN